MLKLVPSRESTCSLHRVEMWEPLRGSSDSSRCTVPLVTLVVARHYAAIIRVPKRPQRGGRHSKLLQRTEDCALFAGERALWHVVAVPEDSITLALSDESLFLPRSGIFTLAAWPENRHRRGGIR